jgi:V/A-type H+-transporting ATPase subunit I
MLQKMAKIQIVGPKTDLHTIVDALYRLGTVQLEDVLPCAALETGVLQKIKTDQKGDLASILGRTDGLLLSLPKIPEDVRIREDRISELRKKNLDELIVHAENILGDLEPATRKLVTEKSDLEFTTSNLFRYKKLIDKIRPIESQLPILEGFEVTVVLIAREFSDVVDIIRNTLIEMTRNQFEMISADIDEKTIATIIIFNRRYSEQVHSYIYSQNVNEIRLPAEYMGKPFNEIVTLIEDGIEQNEEKIRRIDQQLAELSARWYIELFAVQQVLRDSYDEMSVFNKFGQTDFTFVIVGWVPRKYLAKTKKNLMDSFGNRVIINELPQTPEQMEEAPTFYDNPRIVKPFEYLMQLISPPKYMEIDPSPLVTLFFPIFFGLMVGDIAYGLIILAFALIMKWRYKKEAWLQHIMNILIISAFPAIFFGFLFGEFFGDLGQQMGWIQPVEFLGMTWDRIEVMVPLLILAIAIGVFHIFLGLSLGIMNAVSKMQCPSHVVECRKEISEKAGMIGVMTGLIIVITAAAGVAPRMFLEPAVALMAISVPFLIYGRGFFGVFEIISTIGNILSYARIMAIGMASVILALIANKLGGMMEVAVFGFLIAALLHILNIVLAMFSPFLHSLRLHLVEFNSKFYVGGGKMYKPFRKQEDVT